MLLLQQCPCEQSRAELSGAAILESLIRVLYNLDYNYNSAKSSSRGSSGGSRRQPSKVMEHVAATRPATTLAKKEGK